MFYHSSTGSRMFSALIRLGPGIAEKLDDFVFRRPFSPSRWKGQGGEILVWPNVCCCWVITGRCKKPSCSQEWGVILYIWLMMFVLKLHETTFSGGNFWGEWQLNWSSSLCSLCTFPRMLRSLDVRASIMLSFLGKFLWGELLDENGKDLPRDGTPGPRTSHVNQHEPARVRHSPS